MCVQVFHEIHWMDAQNFILKIVGRILVVEMVILMMEKLAQIVHRMWVSVVEMVFWIDEKLVKRVHWILRVVICVGME